MNTTTQHTPGPWQLDNRDGNTTVSGAGHWLATVHRDGCTTAQIHPSIAMAEANARLIAAAPLMLAALELAMEWSNDGSPESEMSAIELEFRDQARAALAAARGH